MARVIVVQPLTESVVLVHIKDGHVVHHHRGEPRSNQTHISTTDPDAKLANKGNGTAAMVGYIVNRLMENRHRLLLGINVESFRGPASEREGGRDLLDAFHHKHRRRIHTVGEDKGILPSRS